MTQSDRVRQASRSRRDAEKQALRQAILDAATAMFRDQGPDAFSIRQVAERIGYSATTLYLYYADREDLLSAVVDQSFAEFRALLTAAASEEDPLARLRAIGRAYVAFGLAHPAEYAYMFLRQPRYLTAGDAPRIGAMTIVADAVAAVVPDPRRREAVADALWAAVHGVVALALAGPALGTDRGQAAASAVLDLVITGLERSDP